MFIHKFAVGDLVRGPRRFYDPKRNKWRTERLGLIQEISDRAPSRARARVPGHSPFLYYVLWSDHPEPQLVPEWDLELVPNEN